MNVDVVRSVSRTWRVWLIDYAAVGMTPAICSECRWNDVVPPVES